MLAVCILALGTVMVQQGFLRSAELMTGASARLGARVWMQEKMWEARERLVYSQDPETLSGQGRFVDPSHKAYDWTIDVHAADDGKDLYAILLEVSWNEGGRSRSVSEEALATLRPPVQ